MPVNGLLLSILLLSGCTSQSQQRMDSEPVLIYLHGMIVENQGAEARHPEYGKYEYEQILQTFRDRGFRVNSEIRAANTDISGYADHVVIQIKELIERGVPAGRITVVGASKGSMIAMVAATRLQMPEVNFVFMAACNEWTASNMNLAPCGRILSIYEQSDEIGRSCHKIIGDRECVSGYKEIQLETGQKHGFLFKPLEEWVEPVIKWAKGLG